MITKERRAYLKYKRERRHQAMVAAVNGDFNEYRQLAHFADEPVLADDGTQLSISSLEESQSENELRD